MSIQQFISNYINVRIMYIVEPVFSFSEIFETSFYFDLMVNNYIVLIAPVFNSCQLVHRLFRLVRLITSIFVQISWILHETISPFLHKLRFLNLSAPFQ